MLAFVLERRLILIDVQAHLERFLWDPPARPRTHRTRERAGVDQLQYAVACHPQLLRCLIDRKCRPLLLLESVDRVASDKTNRAALLTRGSYSAC